jgi:hypothetical protein
MTVSVSRLEKDILELHIGQSIDQLHGSATAATFAHAAVVNPRRGTALLASTPHLAPKLKAARREDRNQKKANRTSPGTHPSVASNPRSGNREDARDGRSAHGIPPRNGHLPRSIAVAGTRALGGSDPLCVARSESIRCGPCRWDMPVTWGPREGRSVSVRPLRASACAAVSLSDKPLATARAC